jgi:hypothetical protein
LKLHNRSWSPVDMLRPVLPSAAGLRCFACSALAQDAGQTRYAVLIMEKPAGSQTTTVAADGRAA